MPPTLEPLPEQNASPFLDAKIAGLRGKAVRTSALTGLAIAVGVGVELLALAMFFDWWLDFPWGVRLILLLAQAGIFTYILLRFVAGPMIHQPDEDELALMVEKARSVFRSRLIAAIQLTRPEAIGSGTSAAMVDALVEETEAIAAPMDFNAIVPTDKVKKLGMMAGLITALGLFGFLYGGQVSRDLFKRVFLSTTPVPRKTRITVSGGNKIVGRGDNVRLEAFVAGVIPGNGKLELKYPSRRVQEFNLEQDRANRRRFGRTIENVQEMFSYAFYLNDAESPTYTVKTIPRPAILSMDCEQQFPAYTKLKMSKRSLGDLSLLAGSRLTLKATATKPIQTASLRFIGAPASASHPSGVRGENAIAASAAVEAPPDNVLLTISGNNSVELSGSFIVPRKGLAGFSVLLLDTEGMESRDSSVYRIDVIPDKPPAVRITYPDRKEELITRQATMPIAFEAADDFALVKLRLRYKTEAREEGAEQTTELDLEGASPQRLKRRHEWKIGSFSPLLPEGSKIEYWIEAEDNNDATGPGIGSSEHHFAKIVSESEKRADLLNRAGDYLGSISDVATDQEKLNQNLGALIREKLTQGNRKEQ